MTDSIVDPMLVSDVKRFVISPQRDEDLWQLYKQAEASFWTTSEIDLSGDLLDWKNKLTLDEQYFVQKVLCFFLVADGIVMENLAVNLFNKVQWAEARAFYAFQIAMENIHSETYSMLLTTLLHDKMETCQAIFDNPLGVPCLKKKADWSLKWITGHRNFAELLVAFAIVEGLFFSASFCTIFWLKKRNLMPGLAFSNELISRDESLHCQFAYTLYKKLQPENKLDEVTIQEMMREAMECEEDYVVNVLDVPLIGLNSTTMLQYTQFVADYILKQLGCTPMYHVKNPYDWMELISMQNKTNMFERRISEYQRRTANKTEEYVFVLDADF